MQRQPSNDRLTSLLKATERRLKRLPGVIRSAFRDGASQQLEALARIEHQIEIIAEEVARQRREMERDAGG
jgi:hypothetical protein